ncbi:MAG: hypothetical protein ACLPR9_05590 [Acidimicrobiales bacterium]|jgi:hypothetical protein
MVQSGPRRLGFIASFVGAFHRPVPHRLPLAVVAPPDGSGKVVAEFNAIPGRPLHASAVPSTEAGTSELLHLNVYGVLFVDIRATSHRLLGALLVFCAGAFSMGLQVVAGTIGIGTDLLVIGL